MTGAVLLEDMPFPDYLAHPALSASGMKRLLDMPARFKAEQDDTAAMRHGRLIHAVTFDQPHEFIAKDWDGRTTEGKAKAAVVASRQLEVVTQDEWDEAEGIAKAVKANKLASSVLFPKGVRHEVSAVWTDSETGVQLRCRFDSLSPTWQIGDLKSTTYAQPYAFAGSAAKFGYYLSAAQYRAAARALDAYQDPEFLLVAVEKKPPHFISVVGITEVDLMLGERLRRHAIRKYAECLERDEWPDYTTEVAYPDAPNWWRHQVEELTGLNQEMVI